MRFWSANAEIAGEASGYVTGEFEEHFGMYSTGLAGLVAQPNPTESAS